MQEAHGQKEHWITVKRQLANAHKIFHSYDPDPPNEAGVAIIFKLKLYRQSFREEVVEVTPGRVFTVRLSINMLPANPSNCVFYILSNITFPN